METRILRLKGRRFACGLAWRPQERRPLDRRLALAEASLQGASHCVQAQVQTGFASLPPQADEDSLRPLALSLDLERLASLAGGLPRGSWSAEGLPEVRATEDPGPEDYAAEGRAPEDPSPEGCPTEGRAAGCRLPGDPAGNSAGNSAGDSTGQDSPAQTDDVLPALPYLTACHADQRDEQDQRELQNQQRLQNQPGQREQAGSLAAPDSARPLGSGKSQASTLRQGHRLRRLSLLAQLQDEAGRPFVWLLVLAEGAVLAGLGDRCFARLDEAREALAETEALLPGDDPGLSLALTCPEESARLLAACLVPVRLAERLGGLGVLVPASRWTSRGARLARRLLGGLALAGLLAGAAWGAAASLGCFEEREGLAQEQALAQWRAHPERAFGAPWTLLPEPAAFVREAARLVYAMPSQPAGWRHEASVCRAAARTGQAGTRRAAGSAASLAGQAPDRAGSAPAGQGAQGAQGTPGAPGVSGGQGTQGALLVQSRYARTPDARDEGLPAGARFDARGSSAFTLEARASGIPLLGQPGLWKRFAGDGELSRSLQILGRAVGAKARTSWKPRQRKALTPAQAGGASGGRAGAAQLDCPWLAGTFEIAGLPAEALAPVAGRLAQMPGLAVTTLTLSQGKWKLAGECHAR